MKKVSLNTLRKCVQWSIIALIAISALNGWAFSSCSFLNIGYLRLVCPVGFLETVLASRSIIWGLVPGFVVVLVLIVLMGRAYCSWACPAGVAKYQAQRLWDKRAPVKIKTFINQKWEDAGQRLTRRFKMGKGDVIAIFAGAAIGIVVFGYPVISLFCPIGIVSRSLIEMVAHFSLRTDLLLLAVPLVGGLFFKHGWKSCCAVGKYCAVVSKLNVTLVPVAEPDACNSCRKCEQACSMNVAHDACKAANGDCIKCMACIDACPNSAAKLALKRTVAPQSKKKSVSPAHDTGKYAN